MNRIILAAALAMAVGTARAEQVEGGVAPLLFPEVITPKLSDADTHPSISQCRAAIISYQGPGQIGDGVALTVNMDGTVYINRTNLKRFVANMPTTGAWSFSDMALRSIAASALHNWATFKTVSRAQADQIASVSGASGNCDRSGSVWNAPFLTGDSAPKP